MLAGIGLTIMLKQIPHALGYDVDWIGDLGFWEPGGRNTFSSIASAVGAMAGGPMVISACSLAVLVAWDKLATAGPRLLTRVPGPLAVVALGIVMNLAFRSFAPGLSIRDVTHIVSLPAGSFRELLGALSVPDFSVLSSAHGWTVAFTIAAVASVETLLSLEAADRIDPQRRMSSPNRELWVQGVGNVVSGMLGGLPSRRLRFAHRPTSRPGAHLEGILCSWAAPAWRRLTAGACAESRPAGVPGLDSDHGRLQADERLALPFDVSARPGPIHPAGRDGSGDSPDGPARGRCDRARVRFVLRDPEQSSPSGNRRERGIRVSGSFQQRRDVRQQERAR